jgi:glycosyltransferase involved in cell wall biosynthesis
VASAVGGTPALLANGATGVLVPPRDPSKLARALGDLCASPQRRVELGTAARQRAIQRYGEEHMVDQYVSLYTDGMRFDDTTERDPCAA